MTASCQQAIYLTVIGHRVYNGFCRNCPNCDCFICFALSINAHIFTHIQCTLTKQHLYANLKCNVNLIETPSSFYTLNGICVVDFRLLGAWVNRWYFRKAMASGSHTIIEWPREKWHWKFSSHVAYHLVVKEDTSLTLMQQQCTILRIWKCLNPIRDFKMANMVLH